ncbi:DUF4810 domain-containing protein [Aestuariibacter halophilus]|uniref:DUF4810 domain-containing protein n=1 Tax=Fluctibacter halophilus TaxID=226011 RepID=A0ABS8G7G3_9ALTE|nr:DUF4810 domain-containing protein [Aestuariibacter halophilus]MCC2616527.1 DUF4810 domain-containing protein [Aestuariibacter halophilus]
MKAWTILGCAALLLAGCSQTPKLYYHGPFNKVMYSYFNGNDLSIGEQITVLEDVIARAMAKNQPVAPGIHAHLGMLYFETGETALGERHLNEEKALFPESAQYMDFLLNAHKDT